MKTVKLTLNEAMTLYRELNGLTLPDDKGNQKVIIHGLLSQKISIVHKYRLSKISKLLEEEKNLYEELRKDLIKKYADDPTSNNIQVSMKIKQKGKEVENPKYKEFIKEIEELSTQEKEYEIPEINLEEMNFETDEFYPLFFDKIV